MSDSAEFPDFHHVFTATGTRSNAVEEQDFIDLTSDSDRETELLQLTPVRRKILSDVNDRSFRSTPRKRKAGSDVLSDDEDDHVYRGRPRITRSRTISNPCASTRPVSLATKAINLESRITVLNEKNSSASTSTTILNINGNVILRPLIATAKVPTSIVSSRDVAQQQSDQNRSQRQGPIVASDQDLNIDNLSIIDPASEEENKPVTVDEELGIQGVRDLVAPILIEDENENECEFVSSNILDNSDEQNRLIDLTMYRLDGFTIRPGKSVELRDSFTDTGKLSRHFMRIESIKKDENGDVFVFGKHMVRKEQFQKQFAREYGNMLSNELVWIVKAIDCVAGISQSLSLTKKSIDRIVRPRQVVLTNHEYPKKKLPDHLDGFTNPKQNARSGPLYCRWKRTDIHSASGRLEETSYETLIVSEADEDFRASNADIRSRWRGFTELGGAHVDEQVIESPDGRMIPTFVEQYTYGDAFSGAGGTSSGARAAGLNLSWAFDRDLSAMATYSLNFASSGTRCLLQDVHTFITDSEHTRPMVDVLHLSCPCQAFSPANTTPNIRNNEINEAASLSVDGLLDLVKPRVVTFEQTPGLLQRHQEWFDRMVQLVTSKNYSIRWRIVNCTDYGVPQSRTRLLMVAAGPGEKLPPFPEPTHSKDGGYLKRCPTIGDTIQSIPDTASNMAEYGLLRNQQPAYDPKTYARTITTGGGINNYHPSGNRTFSVREFASLQTFPLSFKFPNLSVTTKRKQIGNAVPPMLAKALFRTIVKHLRAEDYAEQQARI